MVAHRWIPRRAARPRVSQTGVTSPTRSTRDWPSAKTTGTRTSSMQPTPHGARIDVFKQEFFFFSVLSGHPRRFVTTPVSDGFAPFNNPESRRQSSCHVTQARRHADEDGPARAMAVDTFDLNGNLSWAGLVSQGVLNSHGDCPGGDCPTSATSANMTAVGNFGMGRFNAFNSTRHGAQGGGGGGGVGGGGGARGRCRTPAALCTDRGLWGLTWATAQGRGRHHVISVRGSRRRGWHLRSMQAITDKPPASARRPATEEPPSREWRRLHEPMPNAKARTSRPDQLGDGIPRPVRWRRRQRRLHRDRCQYPLPRRERTHHGYRDRHE